MPMFKPPLIGIFLILSTLAFKAGLLAQETTIAVKEVKTLWQPYYTTPRTGSQHISLDGEWELGYRDTPIDNLSDLSVQQEQIRAQVPDSVQWALYRAGKLPHPYYHLNSRQYSWIPDKVWYYRRTFQVPSSAAGGYAFLSFDGVGYYSKIWLNGTLLGRHEGMFGGPTIEVSQLLRTDQANLLIIEVRAPSYGAKKWTPASTGRVMVPWGLAGGHPDITFKSGIGVKEFLPFGIWRSVRLEFVPHVHLERPFLVTKEVNSTEAHLTLTTEVFVDHQSLEYHLHNWSYEILNDGYRDLTNSHLAEGQYALRVQFRDKKSDRPALEQILPVKIYVGRNWVRQQIRVPSPKLWWPNGMGYPNLYRVKITLLRNGRPVDNLEFDYGIRTIKNIQSAGPRTQDRWTDWQFVINGRPLFIKGANWAWPMDVLLHLPHERYVWDLNAAHAAGIQMLRVWGGGNPETNDFFSLCDQLGIMVWEDFPSANADNPDWPQDAWESQVDQIIFRLRNHPALAVWCGGNEFNPYSFGEATVNGIVARSVQDFDGTRLFTRTTPDPGDLHPYPDMDPTWYSRAYGLVPFVSETGIQDMGDPTSLREVVSPEEFKVPARGVFTNSFTASHPEFVHHFMPYDPEFVTTHSMWSRITQVDDLSAPPLDRLMDDSRIATGEFLQIASDLVQANYPITTGIMPWSFTIPWPIAFPAWVDASDEATAMYYFLKRTYEPTHIVVRLPQLIWAPGEKVPITVAVIHATQNTSRLSASVEIFNGKFESLWKREGAVVVKPGPSITNLDLSSFQIPEDLADKFFFVVAELKHSDGTLVSRSVYWPRSLKKMMDSEFRDRYRTAPQPSLRFEHGPWLRPQVRATHTSLELHVVSEQTDGENQSRLRVLVRNTGRKPAFFTQFDIEGTERAFYGTDNFFWIAPGEERLLEFEVLWKNPASRNKAIFMVRAWNAGSAVAASLACNRTSK
jgi:beta-mannosidase